MRICVIGDEPSIKDEGMRILSGRLASELEKRHEMLYLKPGEIFEGSFWRRLKAHSPDIVHYFPGPTVMSFFVLKAVTRVTDSIGIASATHPHLRSSVIKALPFVRPNLIVCQSAKTSKFFSDIGIRTEILPSGVDIDRFAPASRDDKRKLRDAHGISQDAFIVLHVGHLNRRRNLGQLALLQKNGNVQVIVVVSSSTRHNQSLARELNDSGCIVVKEYIPRIEDLYRLSDCYVFPTRDPLGSIEFPLSILEALSCSLPVVSTRYGSLPEMFLNEDGVFFYDTHDELVRTINNIMEANRDYDLRALAARYAWPEVAKSLEAIYQHVMDRERR